jgi:transcriptional regulator of acetoin/glycerol metabolism
MRSAERAFEEATAGLDHLIAELDRDGARMTDIADTLGISRTTAYARRDRALQRDPDLSHPPGQ